MIVFLEITPKQFDSMESEERESLFRKIVDSSINGFHYFIINQNIFNKINDLRGLSPDEKAHIRTLIENYSIENYDKVKFSRIHMEILFGSLSPKKEKFKWKIGHKNIIIGKYLCQCKLIVEYETDEEFYNYLFKEYFKIIKAKIIDLERIEFHPIGCNGGDTGNILHDHIKKNYTTCCICDTDKLSPNDENGETFRYAESKISDYRFLGCFDGTPCRESENFMSTEILRKLCDDIYKKDMKALNSINKKTG